MTTLNTLATELSAVDRAMREAEEAAGPLLSKMSATQVPSATNLLQYLVLRRFDLRHAQRVLAEHGLSSLGRNESHVRDGLNVTRRVLHMLAGLDWTTPAGFMLTIHDGEELLASHSDALFGPRPSGRAVRVMVTMPSEAADDYVLVRDLVAAGMDCMRINCAHDGPAEWARMIAHLRRAVTETGRNCSVSMDLAGPKLRTAGIRRGPAVQRIKPHRDQFGQLLSPAYVAIVAESSTHSAVPATHVTLVVDGVVPAVDAGSRVKFVDARGKSRVIRVVASHDGLIVGTLDQTAYLVPGTKLHIQSAGTRETLRVAETPGAEQALLLRVGELLVLTSPEADGQPATRDSQERVIVPAQIGVTLPEIFDDIKPDERIWFDDGRIGAVVRQAEASRAVVEITQARPGGDKLMEGKGINLPDTDLHLEPLTAKDLEDLQFIVKHADLVGYSFVRRAADVERLQEQLRAAGGEHLGIILKIETRLAFEELPRLLLTAMRSGRFGVMIARGDLAVECGYERMAEIQEEILWIAEAAHAPVIWATQVLESLAKTGVPSRAEVTDAAMAERAECVMLNKGPFVRDAVRTLDDILTRMETHQAKKRAMLRPLKVAQSVIAEVLDTATSSRA